jgi:chorismate mutase-like protein
VGALVVLIAKRLELGADVAAAKFTGAGQIDDPVREGEILNWVANELSGCNAWREAGVAFFRDQIMANKVIQRGLHNRWRGNPAAFPVRSRRLTAEIRPQLDVINTEMLSLLPSVPHLSCEQLTTADDLIDRKLSASSSLRDFRDIRRAAAHIALRSLVRTAAQNAQ